MEHPLLSTGSMRHVRALISVLLVATALAVPSLAYATPAMTLAFGSHGANANLVMQPVGAAECGTPIPVVLSPVMTSATGRYIDVWSASSSNANCQTPMIRTSTTNPACTFVQSYPYTPTMSTYTLMVSANDLFGGTCGTNTRSFYFFDTASTHDASTPFATYWTLDIAVSATAPPAPMITNTALAGDAVVAINWNASSYTSLGVAGQVYVYAGPSTACGTSVVDAGSNMDAASVADANVDTGGIDSGPADTGPPDTGPVDAGTTPGTDGGTSASLVGGGPAPSMTLWTIASSSNPINLDTARLGWSNAHYGETVAIAIAVVDSAHNVSPLSNVVCASHIVVTGFWDAYCAAHGMSDAACASYYRGCSVGTPSRRNDPLGLGLGLVIAGLFVLRRRRR